jgi:hypothetical protein
MYIDFDQKKLGDELKGKAMDEAEKIVSQTSMDPTQGRGVVKSGEDGGDTYTNCWGTEDGGTPFCGTTT